MTQSNEIDKSTGGIVRCILCGHEGHEDDGETDNYGDWYCETCVEVAPSDETPIVTDGGQPIDGISQSTLVEETERLAGLRYSIETQARIETLLWVLGYIDDDHCPAGAADDRRVRELTNRGPWPFDPDLGGDQA